jgi:hypothetical protein
MNNSYASGKYPAPKPCLKSSQQGKRSSSSTTSRSKNPSNVQFERVTDEADIADNQEVFSSEPGDGNFAANNMAPWDDYNTNRFATRYMLEKGHLPGHGLGLNEDGIREPIEVDRTALRETRKKDSEKETVLICGTSMIGGLKQDKMSKKYKVKVRPHPGARLPAIKHFLNGHLTEKTDHLILQVGTNDAAQKTSTPEDILKGIMDLKTFAEKTSPGVKVTISCPMIRTDNQQAHSKLLKVKKMLMETPGLSTIDNNNITEAHLSSKGLHLKQSGTVQLAMNMIKFMREIGQ